jgi:small-conductance mechanosensitive channel
MAVILGAVAGVPGVSPDPLASMRLRDLTPQSLQVEARFWTDSTRRDFMRTSSSVRIAIVKALRQEGIELPRPDDRRVTLVEPGPRTVEIPPAGG